MQAIERRSFLKLGGFGALATGLAMSRVPVVGNGFITPSAPGFPDKKLMVVFLRGGNDGTNAAPPTGDAVYYNQRGSIAIPAGSALDLGSGLVCGLHPALAALLPVYGDGDLAVIQRVGYHQSSRSHFNAMQHWETAVVDQFIAEGFLGRYLGLVAPTANPLPGGAFYNAPQQLLALEARAFPQINDLTAYSFANDNIRTALGQAYALAYPSTVQADGTSLLESMDLVAENLGAYPDDMVGTYPDNDLGRHFRDAAWAFRETDCGVAVISDGGYDTHSDQGGVNGTQANKLSNLAASMLGFQQDLSILPEIWNNTVVAVISEFGRTDVNASGGTDHGKAGLTILMGGAVHGGAYNCSNATWFNGAQSPLEADGALDHRTDFRTNFAEIFSQHLSLSNPQIDQIIPNWSAISISPDPNHPFEFTPLDIV